MLVRLVTRPGRVFRASFIAAAILIGAGTLAYVLMLGRPGPDLAAYCEDIVNSTDAYFGTGQRALFERWGSDIKGAAAQSRQDSRGQGGLSEARHDGLVRAQLALARDHLRFGETQEAARVLAGALEAEGRDDPKGEHRGQLLRATAVTYLKMGELDNCLTPEGGLVCALPLDGSYVHTDTQGSSTAIGYLLELLELEPDHLTARWLLNVAHMTLGTYPDGVPDRFLVPPEALDSKHEVGRFRNIAADVGLYTVEPAGGSIMEDFDNDGLLDIMWSTWDPCQSMRYFHNDGNGLFSDYTARAGLDGQLGGLNMVQTDYDNDGWPDVLVMRGGWMLQNGRMRMSLLRNNGDGTFTDVTHDAGLATPAYPSQTAAWADYDNDGHLDLYSCNESMPGPDNEAGYVFPSQLFHNRGDGTFDDVAVQAGVTNSRYCKGSVWGDYDNDGDPDLYVSNYNAENRLYRNDGDGTFTDVAGTLGVAEPVFSFAGWFWDYDNDGWLDLFVTGYGADVADIAADYLGLPNDGTHPRLYRNDGAGGFEDVTRQAGLARVLLPMGVNFGDLDNDGFLDFYLGTGDPSFETVVPNVMYRNNGGADFTDVTFSGGFGHLQKGHGIAFGDLDRDGDQDIFAQIGGAYPADAFSNSLFENPGHGNHWLSVRLVGERSNRAAIGARIKVELATEGGSRAVYKHVNSGGSFGASPLEQAIGLGQAEQIISVEVYWPTSGTVQVLRDVPLDTRIEIREGGGGYAVLDLRRFRFTAVGR